MPGEPENLTKSPVAVYANFFKVGHNAVEFLLDFGQHYSSLDAPRLHTRVVTSPMYAKGLLSLLSASLEQYEDAFGPVTVDDEVSSDD